MTIVHAGEIPKVIIGRVLEIEGYFLTLISYTLLLNINIIQLIGMKIPQWSQ